MPKVTRSFIVLYVLKDYWIVSKGYFLYKYYPQNNKLEYFSKLEDKKNRILSLCRYTKRLFRAEITHLYHFQRDNWMCIAKKGIFKYNSAKGVFEKCCHIEKGSKPMSLCQDKDGIIYFGEYCFNPQRNPMNIFKSTDGGDTWEIAYHFKEGEINHIHGIFCDPYTNRIWVATGDDDSACIFGYTEDGFKTLVREYTGAQQYRVCVPLFCKDKIIYATDTPFEQNYIRSIDRKTGDVTDIQRIQGSGIYAAQNGNLMLISTTVEPSDVNKDKYSHLWLSKDGNKWLELDNYKKDILPITYFQFGSIRFPYYEEDSDVIIFHGRSLRKIDSKSVIINKNI